MPSAQRTSDTGLAMSAPEGSLGNIVSVRYCFLFLRIELHFLRRQPIDGCKRSSTYRRGSYARIFCARSHEHPCAFPLSHLQSIQNREFVCAFFGAIEVSVIASQPFPANPCASGLTWTYCMQHDTVTVPFAENATAKLICPPGLLQATRSVCTGAPAGRSPQDQRPVHGPVKDSPARMALACSIW